MEMEVYAIHNKSYITWQPCITEPAIPTKVYHILHIIISNSSIRNEHISSNDHHHMQALWITYKAWLGQYNELILELTVEFKLTRKP